VPLLFHLAFYINLNTVRSLRLHM